MNTHRLAAAAALAIMLAASAASAQTTTTTRATPRTPNTGAGGNAGENALMLWSSAAIAVAGGLYLLQTRRSIAR